MKPDLFGVLASKLQQVFLFLLLMPVFISLFSGFLRDTEAK